MTSARLGSMPGHRRRAVEVERREPSDDTAELARDITCPCTRAAVIGHQTQRHGGERRHRPGDARPALCPSAGMGRERTRRRAACATARARARQGVLRDVAFGQSHAPDVEALRKASAEGRLAPDDDFGASAADVEYGQLVRCRPLAARSRSTERQARFFLSADDARLDAKTRSNARLTSLPPPASRIALVPTTATRSTPRAVHDARRTPRGMRPCVRRLRASRRACDPRPRPAA